MRHLAGSVALLLAVAAFPAALGAQGDAPPSSTAAQPSQQSPSGGLKLSNQSVSAAGCVQAANGSTSKFSLTDQKRGITYLLTGKDISAYEGKKVRIVGGLVPNANVAAQAGAIDPGKAAIESRGQGLAGTGNIRVEDFFVSTIKAMKGTCASR